MSKTSITRIGIAALVAGFALGGLSIASAAPDAGKPAAGTKAPRGPDMRGQHMAHGKSDARAKGDHGKNKSERFKKKDKNGDGFLTKDEVGEKKWQWISAADANKDGKVSLAELQQAFKDGKMHGKRKEAFFKKLDKNNDGFLTKAEVGDKKWERISRADTNKDNKVSLQEMKALKHGKHKGDKRGGKARGKRNGGGPGGKAA